MATISKEQRDDYVSIVMRLDGFKRKDETYSAAVGRLLELAKPGTPAEPPIADSPGVPPSGLANGYIDVVLARGPGPESDFVELEDERGLSINLGTWLQAPDEAVHRLRLPIGLPAEIAAAIDAAYQAAPLFAPPAQAPIDKLRRVREYLIQTRQSLAPLAPFYIAADEGKTDDAVLARLAGELAAWEQAKAAVMLITEHIKDDETMAQGVRRLISRTAGAVAKDVTASVDLLKGVERELGRFRDHDAPAEPLPALAARLGGEVDSCRGIIHKLENVAEDGEAIVDTVNRLVDLGGDAPADAPLPVQPGAASVLSGPIMDAATAYAACQWPMVETRAEMEAMPDWYTRAKVKVDQRCYVRLGGKWTPAANSTASGSATDGACPGCGSVRADQLDADQSTPPWSVRVFDYCGFRVLEEMYMAAQAARAGGAPGGDGPRDGDAVVALARAVRDIASHLAGLWPNDHSTARMHEIRGVCEVICGE